MISDGIKVLDLMNWDEPDPVMKKFVWQPKRDQIPQTVSGEDWVQTILAVKVFSDIPAEVFRLFTVAQSAMIYGYFYYPLFTLGTEQLARVGEAAIRHKCMAHYIPVVTPMWERSLSALLRDLSQAHLLTDAEHEWWMSLRSYRNVASHPLDQAVLSPGFPIDLLQTVARAIDRLFETKL